MVAGAQGSNPGRKFGSLDGDAPFHSARSRARRAQISASFLGLSADIDQDAMQHHTEAFLPQSLSVASRSVRGTSRALGTSFLGLDSVHASAHEFASSFAGTSEDPEVMVYRAEAAADHAEEHSAFALQKAISVHLLADSAIMYCYAAVFLASVFAGVGVVNGVIDWYCTKRDEEGVISLESSLQTSGWVEYRRRFLPSGGPAQDDNSPSTGSGQPAAAASTARGSGTGQSSQR